MVQLNIVEISWLCLCMACTRKKKVFQEDVTLVNETANKRETKRTLSDMLNYSVPVHKCFCSED